MIFKNYSHFKYFLLNVFGFIYSMENVVLAYIVDNLVNMATNKQYDHITPFFVKVFIILGIVFVANLFFNYFKADAIKSTNIKFRKNILKGMLTNNHEESTDLGFLTNDFKLLETNRYEAEIQILINVYTVTIALIYSLYLNVGLTVVFLLGSIIPTVVSNFFQKSIRNASQEWTDANDKYVNQTKYLLSGTEIFNLYNKQNSAVRQNESKILNLENKLAKMNLIKNNTDACLNVVAIIGTFVVPFCIGIILIIKGQTTIGALLAIVQLSNSLTNPILNILNERNNLSTTKKIVQNIDKFINRSKSTIKKSLDNFKSLKIVGLSLQRQKKTLVENLSFAFNKGQKVVVIGPSGSGKSTLLQFLMYGLYGDAEEIELNGKEAKKGSFSDLFSYASQKTVIFPDTLWFNLTLGEAMDKDEVIALCKQLALGDLINEKGLDYQLGENADQLSGGQIARIGLARAILMKRPVLLLDEINASLDHKTAHLIHNYLINSNLTFIEINHHYTKQELAEYDIVLDLKEDN